MPAEIWRGRKKYEKNLIRIGTFIKIVILFANFFSIFYSLLEVLSANVYNRRNLITESFIGVYYLFNSILHNSGGKELASSTCKLPPKPKARGANMWSGVSLFILVLRRGDPGKTVHPDKRNNPIFLDIIIYGAKIIVRIYRLQHGWRQYDLSACANQVFNI